MVTLSESESPGVSLPSGGGAALRRARKERGLSLRELGERAGVSAATLSQLETGKTTLSAERAQSLAAALDVDPHRLHPDLSLDGRRDAAPEGPGDWRHFPPLQLDVALRGALQSFTEKGFHGSSVRDIARRAGLSVPGLYHYYPSKQAMLSALFDLGMDDLLARSRVAREEGADTRERFVHLVEALSLFHAHRPELSFLGTSEMRALPTRDRRRHAEIRSQQQHMVDDEVELGVEEGVFTTSEPRGAARAVVTMCQGIARWYRPGGLYTPEQIAAQYVEFSLGTVGARP
ncbi:TetR family transcriptional regulator [Nocardioides campestrisoli]|uniref:TetR family transcriptional regulator n=1 Tax=Nocardioides campestrisoli TaxID=2736757 RepID=UPI001CD2C16A|nr:TetR family transcriptional regulator [Nocardioides campestrisoli]